MKNVLNTLKTLKSVATGYAQELADEALTEAKSVLDEAKKARINTRLKDQINLNDLAHNIREVNKANGWGIKEPSEHQKKWYNLCLWLQKWLKPQKHIVITMKKIL